MSKKPEWDVLGFEAITYLGVTFTYKVTPYKITRFGLEEIKVD